MNGFLTVYRLQSSHDRLQAMQVFATNSIPQVRVWSLADRLPALAALLFGMFVLYGVGFSTMPKVHNAVHDTRHANGFPCH
jgi:cobalt transporter subunit CbtB